MNYFTHAVRFLDSPYFVVGACVPDMLSVIDRKARVRRKTIASSLEQLGSTERDVAEGIIQHLDDDQWFHGTAGFYSVTAQIAGEFRNVLTEEDSWRCGFLGHISMELLLDAVLIEKDRSQLDRFYQCLEEVDHDLVQSVVSNLATREVPRLAEMLKLFLKERFLDDYLDDERLLYRLNQVMRRIGLEQLPGESVTVLETGREIVRTSQGRLLEKWSTENAI